MAMISLEHEEKRMRFAMAEGSSLGEIRVMLHESFELKGDVQVVGVRNVSTNVVYPLGIMVKEPALFTQAVYQLLLG